MFFAGDVRLDLASFAKRFGDIMKEVYKAVSIPDLPGGEREVLRSIVVKPKTQANIARELEMDTGLVNRRVKILRQKGFIIPDGDGKTRGLLRATPEGREVAANASYREREIINQVLEKMTTAERGEFFEAAARLGNHRDEPSVRHAIQYREARPGEMAYVLESIVGAVDEPNDYDFDDTFEAYVLELLASVASQNMGPGYFVLIAEVHGQVVGSVICGTSLDGAIEFSLLTERYGYMDRGIGTSLIAQALTKARSLGFKRATAISYDGISGAQPYRDAGWKLSGTDTEVAFGQSIKIRTWTLDL